MPARDFIEIIHQPVPSRSMEIPGRTDAFRSEPSHCANVPRVSSVVWIGNQPRTNAKTICRTRATRKYGIG